MNPAQLRRRFAALHRRDGIFVMPNPWDVGSAKLLAHAGFEALATTSAGFAWSIGRADQQLSLESVLRHVRELVAELDVPLNVDSERCYAEDPDGVAATVQALHAAGASGCSIEDYNPATSALDELSVAVERVAAAAEAAHAGDDPMLLTARCESLLYGGKDLDDVIERLVAYRDAGADCVYAPGLATTEQIREVASAVGIALNVLAWPGGPSVAEIGRAGGRRVSLGSALASTAYGAAMAGARELLEHGTTTFRRTALSQDDRSALMADD